MLADVEAFDLPLPARRECPSPASAPNQTTIDAAKVKTPTQITPLSCDQELRLGESPVARAAMSVAIWLS